MTTALLTLLAIGSSQSSARTIVERSIARMGGAERLSSIRQLKITTAGHSHLVEQSERPTGPFLVTYSRAERTYDFDALSETGTETLSGLVMGPKEFTRPLNNVRTAGRGLPPDLVRRLLLGPERVLLLAQKASDLRRLPDVQYQGAPHGAIGFRWGKVPVRVLLNESTGMPTAVTTTEQRSDFWEIWGDTETTVSWGNWSLLPGGVWEPMQSTTTINGTVIRDETAITAEATLRPGTAVLLDPPTVPKRDQAAMATSYRPTKIAEGVTQFVGPYNVTVVEQPDGLVVFEPVISSAFSAAFLDRLAKEYPGKRVKGVVATDDAWPHFGGIRTYVARGIEVYILDANRAIVEGVLKSPRTIEPDELARKSAKAKLRLVRRATTVGSGDRRFVLYPVAGEASERMLMAYFPASRLLYGTDLLQRTPTGFFFPAYPQELRNAVEREGLPAEQVFGEHLPSTPWSAVTGFLDGLKSGG